MTNIRDIFVDKESPRGGLVQALAALGTATAGQLVKHTGLGRSTVSNIINELRAEGLVIEVDAKSEGFGRPSQLLSLNPRSGRCAGVLLGLSEIRIVVCDLTHSVLSDKWLPIHRDYTPEDAAKTVSEHLDKQCAKLGITLEDLLGVGLAISAPVSLEGTILTSGILRTWRGVDLAKVFSKYIDCPLHAENESNCGALAEMTWGAARGEPNFVLFKFDFGVGGAVVRDGVIERGSIGSAAEFGHIVLDPQGKLCGCGNRGCMHQTVGLHALMKQAEALTHEPLTVEQFIEAARDGRLGFQRLVEDAATQAGWAMGLVGTILNPPLFVVVGKLALLGETFLEQLRHSYTRHSLPPPDVGQQQSPPRFVIGRYLANDDTVMGAVALVLHQHAQIA